jgi:hypothetical protein
MFGIKQKIVFRVLDVEFQGGDPITVEIHWQ